MFDCYEISGLYCTLDNEDILISRTQGLLGPYIGTRRTIRS